MVTFATPMPILAALISRPSRASAAAIGHRFVLNGTPPALRVRGLDALGDMVCDWSVAIFEEAINDPSRGYTVRQHALTKLSELLDSAIDRGYAGLTRPTYRRLARQARTTLRSRATKGAGGEIQPVEDLCDHLSQAVADGVFGQLPDF